MRRSLSIKKVRFMPETFRRRIRGFLERVGIRSMGISSFENLDAGQVAQKIRSRYNYNGPLLDIFSGHQGTVVHKWHHYIPLYDRYLSNRRGNVRFLEIGVSKGGSLEMWRRYLGDSAAIFGVDINAACMKYDGLFGSVRIGSQSDPEFLRSVVQEMGGVDIILDDGSHRMADINKSLSVLFPMLSEDGLYIIEDLHTAYWRSHGGGGRRTFFRHLVKVFDDMHRWYHSEGVKTPGIGDACVAVHVHDSFVVLEKGVQHRPEHSRVGVPEGD